MSPTTIQKHRGVVVTLTMKKVPKKNDIARVNPPILLKDVHRNNGHPVGDAVSLQVRRDERHHCRVFQQQHRRFRIVKSDGNRKRTASAANIHYARDPIKNAGSRGGHTGSEVPAVLNAEPGLRAPAGGRRRPAAPRQIRARDIGRAVPKEPPADIVRAVGHQVFAGQLREHIAIAAGGAFNEPHADQYADQRRRSTLVQNRLSTYPGYGASLPRCDRPEKPRAVAPLHVLRRWSPRGHAPRRAHPPGDFRDVVLRRNKIHHGHQVMPRSREGWYPPPPVLP